MKYFLFTLIMTANLTAVDFNKDVRVILSRKCFSCHGAEKQKGKLRLDQKKFAVKAFKEKDGKIPLLSRINHNDLDEIMPPPEKGKLTAEEKAILEKWVKEGALYQKHWAFIPPVKSPPPKLNNSWIKNEIDKFILQKLNEKNLKPNKVTFDYRLFRRLSFILTGLPPTDKQTDLFYKNELNYETYLDSLLNSSAYGEHMAQFWLDAVRYADTNGIEYDNSRPIWPYRDWVIKAFNDNMPYNQFLTEQVAGDLIKDCTVSQITATGFLRCNPTTNEMGTIEEEMQVQYAKDRLNTTMSVFNGLTVGCAECHDHKYDPFSQKDYYRMLAYFNNIDGKAIGHIFDRADEPVVPVDKEKFKEIKILKSRIKNLDSQMHQVMTGSKDKFWWWHQKQLNADKFDLHLIAEFDAFYPFNEKDKFTTENIINGTKSSLKGVTFRQEGKQEGGIEFRQSCYIDCTGVPAYGEHDSFTVGGWIKFSGESSGLIMGKYYNNKGWALTTEDHKVVFNLSHSKDNAIIVKSPDLNLEWNHLAFVYDGSKNAAKIKCFVNGKQVKHEVVQNNLNKSAHYSVILRIGSLLNWCRLDNLFCAKKALNENEINTVKNFDPVKRFAYTIDQNLNKEQKSRLMSFYLKNVNKEYKKLYIESRKLKEKTKSILKDSTLTMIMKEKTSPQKTYLLKRGNYLTPGEEVSRKLPDSIYKYSEKLPDNRLGVAAWMTDKKNPLTSRVIVNKIWLNIFGRGLVQTPGDFGFQGSAPTHPELLDYLSVYFVENNWNIKKLIKFILSSSTFQQVSIIADLKRQQDPDCSHYSYFKRRRLTGEAIRDQALAVSGLLINKLGGKPVFPYQPMNLWKEVTASTSDTERYVQSSGEDNYRRSIYTFWKRNFPPPLMTIFDAPTRHFSQSQRNISNSPLQALALLNDNQLTETHEALSLKLSNNLSKEEKIAFLYRKIFKRPPSVKELKLIKNRHMSWTALTGALMNLDEFISIE